MAKRLPHLWCENWSYLIYAKKLGEKWMHTLSAETRNFWDTFVVWIAMNTLLTSVQVPASRVFQTCTWAAKKNKLLIVSLRHAFHYGKAHQACMTGESGPASANWVDHEHSSNTRQKEGFMEWRRGRKFGTIVWWFHFGRTIPQPTAASGRRGDGTRLGQMLATGASNFSSQNGAVSWHQLNTCQLREAGRCCALGQSWLYYTASHLRLHKTLTG